MNWIDAHLDLAYIALDGRDIRKPCAGPAKGCISLPALREANINIVCATIFSAPGPIAEADAEGWQHPCRYPSSDDIAAAYQAGFCQIEFYQKLEAEGELSIVRCRADLNSDSPLPKIVLLMEGADPIRGPDDVKHWHDHGLRMVGLTWSKGTRYAGGNANHGPLTPLGIELVSALDDFGIIHDASHLADAALDGLFEYAKGPIVATHSNCRSITCDDQRHLNDAHIKEIGNRGGIIGLNLFSKFLVSDGRATIEDCIDHIQHICKITGHRKAVALGSDADGGFPPTSMPTDLDHPSKYSALIDALSNEGWSETELRDFCFRNWFRVLDYSLHEA